MLLVHQHKKTPGRIEVAWTWLPYFLAADQALIKQVDNELGSLFKGQEVTTGLLWQMHYKVLDIIYKKYPINGLEGYLERVTGVSLEEPNEVA